MKALRELLKRYLSEALSTVIMCIVMVAILALMAVPGIIIAHLIEADIMICATVSIVCIALIIIIPKELLFFVIAALVIAVMAVPGVVIAYYKEADLVLGGTASFMAIAALIAIFMGIKKVRKDYKESSRK